VGWAFNPRKQTATCFPTPGRGPLAMNSLVHITSPATPVVNFGCPLNSCIFTADGRNPSSAMAPFPFVGMREFSLVLRVGTEVFQGGRDARFTTRAGGTLELCNNDNSQEDNGGGWAVEIHVDQLGKG
jgi:hypothetical protein